MRAARPVAIVAAGATLAFAGHGAGQAVEPRCDATTARTVFSAYLGAFNRGDLVQLNALFAQPPQFQWYTVAPPGGRTGVRAFDRRTLFAYFRGRQAKRETLRLTRFVFASTQERDGALLAHFNGELTRRADDVRAGRRGFKASLRCEADQRRFVVLGIGTRI